MSKVAFITGITGQDGAYLAEFLLNKGYIVHGLKRRTSLFNTERINHIYEDPHNSNTKFFLHFGDMTDSTNLIRLVQEIQPDEIYNLAAMSHVRVSFDIPEYVADTDGIGTLRLLEAIRICGLENKTKIYQASTSELFGKVQEIPQTEKTPFYPRSPYGVAKLYAFWITKNYREAYDVFACNGILFNHESPIRGETFITRKITRGVAAIAHGNLKEIQVGNLDAKRDWGHAKDYVKMMWMILQYNKADDWVIATGKTTSVRDFILMAFLHIGIKLKFEGLGLDEVGIVEENNGKYNIKVGSILIRVNPKYYRPTEVELLVGDATKAKKELGWIAETPLNELVSEMVDFDMKIEKRKKYLKEGGFNKINF